MSGNLLYAQSGGVTAVINATAAAVLRSARAHPDRVGRIYGARYGILGVLREELVDTAHWTDADIGSLEMTPGGVFGSCRYKLGAAAEDDRDYRRIIEVFRAHDIRYFLYNGGNDSADTALKISRLGAEMDHRVVCVGVPKTVDNDLPETDSCPGFGSAAKYLAVSIAEADLDIAAMADTSTKVFIMEVMGRHAGWLAAACGLAATDEDRGPHLILFPELPFDRDSFLSEVSDCVDRVGHCTVVVSEGVRDGAGRFLADRGRSDAFGHRQLGGAATALSELVTAELGLKNHRAIPDYLQRSARHLASATDLAHAIAVGEAGVDLALEGRNATMPVIRRIADDPYEWEIGTAQLESIANLEKPLPAHYIGAGGCRISAAARSYLAPLVDGVAYPRYAGGLPDYRRLPLRLVDRQLPAWEE